MIPSIFTTLATGIHVLSQAGQAFVAAILIASTWVPGSSIITGHTFVVPDANTTTSPATYLNDETTPIETLPVTVGTEYCTGHTGALLCTVMIKLTGSGGHRNHNAGSYLCATSTCSIVDTRLMTESGADLIYGGWTTSPLTNSGTQLFNRKLMKNGITLPGSGAYVIRGQDSSSITTVTKDVPPGSTIKFQWETGNGTEDYSRTKAAVLIRFWKFYTP